jgi:hypothetical protein
VAQRLAPDPSADVLRGSEEAFADGLQRRELPAGRGPQRWTGGRAAFRFPHARGPAVLTVEMAGHRAPVAVAVDGAIVGVVDPGARTRDFELPASDRGRRVELVVPTFRAGDGRDLGTLLGRVTLRPRARSRPALALVALLVLPALLMAGAALALGWTAVPATALGTGAAVAVALVTLPSGALFSPYLARAALLVSAGVLVAAAWGRGWAGVDGATGRAAFLSLWAAFLVQVVLGTSPLMIVSDAVFHANKLAAAAAGDLFPVSVTQHARPFRFPYGVSFYAVLAPLARLGLDTVGLVRVGAAVSGLFASALVFAIVRGRWGALAAGAATILLQLLPGVFDVAYSYGNLSNAFGQAATVAFIAWWISGRGGWAAGAALFVLAALAHFSCLVVLVAVAAALLLLPGARPDGTRAIALGLGAALAALYYLPFAGLVFEQLPRLVEGGGQGRGPSRSAWDAARLQVLTAVGQWGLPSLVLAWFGRPRPAGGPVERTLAAWWVGAGALALPAIVSPIEVRYVYALTAPLAAAAGAGLAHLHDDRGGRRAVGWTLVAAQAALGISALVHALLVRYRG